MLRKDRIAAEFFLKKDYEMYELAIPIKEESRIPLYEQIYEYIKREIKEKRIPAGDRLPSTRALASQLGISRSTAQLAYEQLLSEGYMESRPCKGYYAASLEGLVELLPVTEQRQKPAGMKEKHYRYDFSYRGIDWDKFPFGIWRKLNREILVNDNKDLFATGDPKGEEEFRRAISSYLHAARGVNCLPEQILVGAGSEYLLMLLSRMLGSDKCVAMENPTYRQAFRVLCSLGHPVVPVEMDKSGLSVERLEESGAEIAYVMPSHQYPTGIVMPIKRRMELLAWASACEGRYVIEDDYDSEFRYRGKPIPSLQGSDPSDHVIYIGTFSRSIAPAIRISYMVLPKSLLNIYERDFGFFSSTVSRIDQKLLGRFLAEGCFERHLNRMRSIYKSKHDALLEALEALEDEFWISGEHAGVHVLLRSKRGVPESQLIASAAERGVKVYGLSDLFIGEPLGAYASTVMLGYVNLQPEQIFAGVAELKKAWCR
jgi:GntR family transcriptional regulator/MocR family aminotransferase